MNKWGVGRGSMTAALGAAVLLWTQAAQASTVDTPVISCVDTTSDVTVTVHVCGGNDTIQVGAPAGFSLQWMSAADYAANGNQWYDSEDARLCKASFSGVPCTRRTDGSPDCTNRFSLGPTDCTDVEVGNLFDEEVGLSSNCYEALSCGTEYVFRAFAHAYRLKKRSAFTDNLSCSTDPCVPAPGCTLTQGFWKTHNDTVCASDPNAALCLYWPVTTLTLGTVSYNQQQLLDIFNKPAQGNGLLTLAHQLIAAKLNIANGADGTSAAAAIAAADAMIGSLVVPPVGTDSLAPSTTSGLVSTLTQYNEGKLFPGHCE